MSPARPGGRISRPNGLDPVRYAVASYRLGDEPGRDACLAAIEKELRVGGDYEWVEEGDAASGLMRIVGYTREPAREDREPGEVPAGIRDELAARRAERRHWHTV